VAKLSQTRGSIRIHLNQTGYVTETENSDSAQSLVTASGERGNSYFVSK
jgi:hypothetical protein